MDKVFEYAAWLGSNPWLAISSFLLAIVGLVLAIGFYLKSRRLKIPCYATRSINLVEGLVNRFESLDIRYGGSPIENLTVTKLAFWNSGKETINNADIPSAVPILITAKDDNELLDAKVIYASNPANQFSLRVYDEHRSVSLEFDYLDQNEGALIQIIHTGTLDDHIEITGTIKGAGKLHRISVSSVSLFRILNQTVSRFSSKFIKWYFGLVFLLSPFLVGLAFLIIGYPKTSTGRGPSKGILLLVTFIVGLPYWAIAFTLLRRRMPKGFEAFEKDS